MKCFVDASACVREPLAVTLDSPGFVSASIRGPPEFRSLKASLKVIHKPAPCDYVCAMNALEEAKQILLPRLTPREKAELLSLLERETSRVFPGIEKTPGVCGGSACIAGTRIPVWGLEEARRQGATEAQLLLSYPTLRAEDLALAWAYIEAHRNEIEQEIRANAEA
jgi:uncharacterized protein (DUF433 family)